MSASNHQPQSLPRHSRIKRSGDFSKIKERGKRLSRGCLIINWALNQGCSARLGVVTSRRVGGAVVRNRARRLLREVFRKHQGELASPLDIVLVARPSIAGKSFGEVEKDFLAGMSGTGLLNLQH